jgi:hypothetical protein
MRFLFVLIFSVLSLAPSPGRSEAGGLPPPTGRPILEVSGAIGRTNAPGRALFDLAAIEALGLRELTTRTPWTEGEQRFSGVDPRALLAAVEARGEELEASALDGYRVVVPIADLERFPMLLATRRDGRPMPVRERGPLWLVYPWSTHPETVEQPYRGRAIWQLRSIVVR